MSVDMFCKIEGIDGESTDDKHGDWIEIQGYSHGVSQPVSGASRTGGRTGGRAEFGEFSVQKSLDKATPDINLYCCNGKHISKVEIEFCLATKDKHTFMKYELKDVIVSSVSSGGSSNSGEIRPDEQVSFAYGEIKWEYTPVNQKGEPGAAVDRTWILEENKQG